MGDGVSVGGGVAVDVHVAVEVSVGRAVGVFMAGVDGVGEGVAVELLRFSRNFRLVAVGEGQFPVAEELGRGRLLE